MEESKISETPQELVLAKSSEPTALIRFADQATSFDELLTFCDAIAKSNLVNGSPTDIAAKILLGRELGLGAATSLFDIIVIEGKPSPPAYVQSRMLTENGVKINILKDFERVKIVTFENQLSETYTLEEIKKDRKNFFILGVDNRIKDNKPKENQEIVKKIVVEDIVTEIQFILPNNHIVVSSFAWSEAVQWGLATKQNWIKMPKDMMYARALTRGVRRFLGHLTKTLSYLNEELDPDKPANSYGDHIDSSEVQFEEFNDD